MRKKRSASVRILRMAMIAASLLASAVTVAHAGQAPAGETPAPPARTWAISLQWENDTFGDTDQSYTNGLGISVSHTGSSWADPLFDWLPWRTDRRTVSYTVSQAMFTPEDTDRKIPDPTDRPYAGVLAFTLGLHAEQANRYHGLRLVTGVAGRSSGAGATQRQVHRIIHSGVPQGWDSQLDNEPILNLGYEHRRKYRLLGAAEGWGVEAIPVAAVAAGNLLTQGHLAGVVRLGYNIPQDFGPSLVRSMSELPPPRPSPTDSTSAWKSLGVYLHAGAGMNVVLRDLTLDGNTFKDGPHVASELFVPGAMVGMGISHRRFLATFQYVFLGKEFEGQRTPAKFGALTLSYLF